MLERKEIEERVKLIVVKQLRVEAEVIKTDSSFIDALGADSLGIVELVMAMEEEFGFEIPDDEAENLRTFGNAVEYIVNNQA